ESQELMLISSNGTLVRTPVADVSVVGRNTQGVRLIRLDEGERLVGVERIESLDDDGQPAAEDESTESSDGPAPP
ncbi:MAG TPA: DNA gyrase C-terminal beta-propeller domain-containing protein, partial [Steroidobacteraceae bacterium]|nr:DNA gyrase C-terminal beta-propeller domain-containing protein [Steroidobacteraceae bacterium]